MALLKILTRVLHLKKGGGHVNTVEKLRSYFETNNNNNDRSIVAKNIILDAMLSCDVTRKHSG